MTNCCMRRKVERWNYDEADDDELLYEKEGRKMELRPKDAGQSSGIRLQHFQEEFVHHDTAVFLEVEPELLGQQLDVGDGGQQQEELAQAAGLTPVTRLDAVDQRILQLVLKTPHRLPGLQPHVCNHHKPYQQSSVASAASLSTAWMPRRLAPHACVYFG